MWNQPFNPATEINLGLTLPPPRSNLPRPSVACKLKGVTVGLTPGPSSGPTTSHWSNADPKPPQRLAPGPPRAGPWGRSFAKSSGAGRGGSAVCILPAAALDLGDGVGGRRLGGPPSRRHPGSRPSLHPTPSRGPQPAKQFVGRTTRPSP